MSKRTITIELSEEQERQLRAAYMDYKHEVFVQFGRTAKAMSLEQFFQLLASGATKLTLSDPATMRVSTS